MTKLPRPAQYLLRIDDLCPTVHARRWDRICGLIRQFGIRPILAIVPENQDPELRVSAPDPDFWRQMRELELAGATVAIHGYTHVCGGSGKSLIPMHRSSEFAGLPVEVQRSSIAHGRDVLRRHGLHPELWVAPRHTFDWNTLRALRKEGIHYLSDGLARVPFERGGVTWIPAQLGSPAYCPKGLWTICLHPNTTHLARFEDLRSFLALYAAHFTTFGRVVEEFPLQPLGSSERLHEIFVGLRLRLRRSLRRGSRRR